MIWQAGAPFDGGNHRGKRNVETTEVVGSIGACHWAIRPPELEADLQKMGFGQWVVRDISPVYKVNLSEPYAKRFTFQVLTLHRPPHYFFEGLCLPPCI